MGVQGFAALSALVLRRALTKRSPVRAGYADGHALAALQLRSVRRLIVVPRIGCDIVSITLLVVVELQEAGIVSTTTLSACSASENAYPREPQADGPYFPLQFPISSAQGAARKARSIFEEPFSISPALPP